MPTETELTEIQPDASSNEAVDLPQDQYPTGTKLVLISLALILSIFLSALDSTILATAIPKITTQFKSLDDVGWYSSAYAVSNAAFQSTWGKGYKYFPMKRVYLIAVFIFELGNVVCGAAPNSMALIIGRVIAGVGGAGVMTGVFIMIAFTAKPKYKAAYFGLLGVTFGCSSVVGPLVSGALADGPGWRWCFWINLPIGALAAGMMTICFVAPRAAAPAKATLKEKIIHMDLQGSVTIMAASVCFVLAMHWAGTIMSWSSPPVIGSLAACGALFVLFLVNEWQMGDRAMIQQHLLKNPFIRASLVYQFFLAGLYFSLLYSLPIQFQAIDDDSATQSGVRLIPLVLGISVVTMIANTLLTFWRCYTPLLVMGAISGTAGAAMIYSLNSDASVAKWVAYEIVAAIGIGMALQIPLIANQAAVAPEDIAAVTSLTLFVETLGMALFVAAGEAAFTNKLVTSLAENVPRLDPLFVVNAGATQIREIFDSEDVQGILMSYLAGCKTNHLVSVACGGLASAVSIGIAVPAGVKQWDNWRHKPHMP